MLGKRKIAICDFPKLPKFAQEPRTRALGTALPPPIRKCATSQSADWRVGPTRTSEHLRAPTLGPAWGNSRICKFANLRIDPTLSRARGGRCAAGAARRARRGGRCCAAVVLFLLVLIFFIFGHWAFCLSVVGCVFSLFPIYVFVFFFYFLRARARRALRGGRPVAGAARQARKLCSKIWGGEYFVRFGSS